MIRVNDNWVIDVDDHNYTLKKDLHKKKKDRDGKIVDAYRVVGYFSTTARALDRLGEEILRDHLREPINGLAELADAVGEAQTEWRKLVFKITEGNDVFHSSDSGV